MSKVYKIFFITRANRRLFFVLPFLAIIFCMSSANAQTSVTAQITVSVTVAQPSPPPDLPDFQTWFESFFGGSTQSHEVTSTSDYDGDGHLDYLEYYAGTDPTDGASRLNIATVELSREDAEITWTSVPDDNNDPPKEPGNRFYRIFRCGPDALGILVDSNATISSLQSEGSVTDLGEVNSDGETTSYTDVGAKSQFPLFYRVFLSKPEPQSPTP